MRFAWKALTFLALGVAVSAADEPVPSVPTAAWTAAAPYPTTNSRYAFAQNGEDFYVLGGSNGFSSFDTLRRYNAMTNVWTTLAPIPGGGQAEGVAAYYAGKIYLTGDAGSATDQMRIYDIATNSWSFGAPKPVGAETEGAAAGAFGGRVYVAGGADPSFGPSFDLWVYDIASNTWSAGPTVPFPYRFGGYTQVGQFLYLVGGATFTSGVNSSATMRFDMANNFWETGPGFLPRRADFALAAAGAKLFAIGGDLNGGNFFNASALVNELDIGIWPSGPWVPSADNLPSPRQGNQAGFFSTGRAGGEIWSTGGFLAVDFKNVTYLSEHLFRPTPVPPCPDYHITASTRTFVPATTDIGNHCNDCVTQIMFAFPVRVYGTTYLRANASSNGTLQFGGANTSSTNTDLPAPGFNTTIFPFWDNLTTSGAGNGIFSSLTGTAPNRIFTLEWRVNRITGGATTRFAIRFQEGVPDFEILYGPTTGNFFGTIGIQRDDGSIAQFSGPTASPPAAGTRLIFTTGCCPPIAFNGAIGSGSKTYPGASGFQTGRVAQNGIRSLCGSQKAYPGTISSTSRTADIYSFTNSGPATCVTFTINTACSGNQLILPVAYLGSFNSGNIATNYLGDPGGSPLPFETFSVDVPANATVKLVVSEVNLQGACGSYDVVVTGLSCPLELTKAVSRKTHGAAGEFDITLPLTGEPGVECRSSSGNHKLVFTATSELTGGNATVTAGTGSAGPPSFLGTTMTVPLSGVTDLQKITLTLSGVTNNVGQVLPTTAVSMNVLAGDTSGNRSVNSTDIGQTKANSGVPVSATSFRTDMNANGSINATDIGQVKANAGHTLPPTP